MPGQSDVVTLTTVRAGAASPRAVKASSRIASSGADMVLALATVKSHASCRSSQGTLAVARSASTVCTAGRRSSSSGTRVSRRVAQGAEGVGGRDRVAGRVDEHAEATKQDGDRRHAAPVSLPQSAFAWGEPAVTS
jgi:hypothetical protein